MASKKNIPTLQNNINIAPIKSEFFVIESLWRDQKSSLKP